MALGNAKLFLEKAMKDAELNEKVRMKGSGDVAALAEGMGYDFMPEELETALQEFRQAPSSVPETLETEEMDRVTGSGIWSGEDAPDGHEMGCIIAYHGIEWQYEHEIWCKLVYFCYINNIGGISMYGV